ncbi:hypothetical protein OG345_40780 (plasmid) [Streptomyces sp. NBC_01220]|uniref:hypothetical protein n=1 Tax=Streptomyces sp. NBC_01220 TaxID=2903781 RepID=UPI00352C4E6C|nr:hypothetical protein OG345_40780 [Streptomyces sp. NBC_01220]
MTRTRTPGDITRRRSIADAAGGFPTRAAVVLYACIQPGQDEAAVTALLRRHAEARDWVVAAEVVDHTSTATPLDRRPNWERARLLITTGQARGIVTTSRAACADTGDAPAVEEWLAEHQAFLSEARPAVHGAVR